jgi:hypothetical protein
MLEAAERVASHARRRIGKLLTVVTGEGDESPFIAERLEAHHDG